MPGTLRTLPVVAELEPQRWETRPKGAWAMPNVFLFSLQGDDGPDVRGGSGDILLVHATETDRKGTVDAPKQR